MLSLALAFLKSTIKNRKKAAKIEKELIEIRDLINEYLELPRPGKTK